MSLWIRVERGAEMRIDMPTCGFDYCKKNFDGNCHALGGQREGCEFRVMEEKIKSGDLAEVVRCKNCKYFLNIEGTGYTACRMHEHIAFEDGHCSWGERREPEGR